MEIHLASKTNDGAQEHLEQFIGEGRAFVAKQKAYRMNAAAQGRTVSK